MAIRELSKEETQKVAGAQAMTRLQALMATPRHPAARTTTLSATATGQGAAHHIEMRHVAEAHLAMHHVTALHLAVHQQATPPA